MSYTQTHTYEASRYRTNMLTKYTMMNLHFVSAHSFHFNSDEEVIIYHMTIGQRVKKKVRCRVLEKWWLMLIGDVAVVVSYDYCSASAYLRIYVFTVNPKIHRTPWGNSMSSLIEGFFRRYH